MENQLKEILEEFQWTWDNMGSPHTSDHFNRPANGIKILEDLIKNSNIDRIISIVQSSDCILDARQRLEKYFSGESNNNPES